MSMRQPVRRAARRAFCPSLPMASESWKSLTMTVAVPVSSSRRTSRTRAGADRVDVGVVGPHGDLGAVARLPGRRLDLDHTRADFGHLEFEETLDQPGVRTA